MTRGGEEGREGEGERGEEAGVWQVLVWMGDSTCLDLFVQWWRRRRWRRRRRRRRRSQSENVVCGCVCVWECLCVCMGCLFYGSPVSGSGVYINTHVITFRGLYR